MIHCFNEMGMASLDPKWAGGRPRRITTEDETFILTTAKARPESVGLPFTRWSIRKLVDYLADNPVRRVAIGRERLWVLLARNDVAFQRTKTWREKNDPLGDQKLDRIEEVLEAFPDRVFAFEEFGPLGLLPIGGSSWSVRDDRSACGRTFTRRPARVSSTAATASVRTCSSGRSGRTRGRPSCCRPVAPVHAIETAAALLSNREGILTVVRREFPPRLHGSWNENRPGPVADWVANLVHVRNGVVHAGRAV